MQTRNNGGAGWEVLGVISNHNNEPFNLSAEHTVTEQGPQLLCSEIHHHVCTRATPSVVFCQPVTTDGQDLKAGLLTGDGGLLSRRTGSMTPQWPC